MARPAKYTLNVSLRARTRRRPGGGSQSGTMALIWSILGFCAVRDDWGEA